ncbi:MAG TPA: hypothetical protein VGD57_00115 [Candidatus Dormibacteraeota bacterium]
MAMLAAVPGASAAMVNPGPGYLTVSQNGYAFRNFQLGTLPAERCPSTISPCQNLASEPAIRSDPAGTFYGSSENGLIFGTEAWKSTDRGLHYTHLLSPNQISGTSGAVGPGLSPAGGDTDLSTASRRNSAGLYNVYVASLQGVDIAVSTSADAGQTWLVNHAASKFPIDDREWIAADGASKVCISYVSHAGFVLPQLGLHVECSYDAGATFSQLSDAINPLNIDSRLGFKIGNLTIDRHSDLRDPARLNDILYATYSGGTAGDVTNPSANNHVVWMAVSRDGGRTFNDYQVYNNPDSTADYGHQFTNVSVDAAGNVYSFFSDDHNLYFMFSSDHGQTWHGNLDGTPILVNKPPSNTAIFPWSAAGGAGKVDVVWYGTDFYAPVHPDNYPPTAAWYVYFGQNLHATTVGSTFTQGQASPVVHYGGVCEGGAGCTTGNRDLYDDIGVATNARTGMASIIYSDDQYEQFSPAYSSPYCAHGDSNSRNCGHTNIATQTAGPGVGRS